MALPAERYILRPPRLALGDFELALRGLLGDGAPLSASSLVHITVTWQVQYTAWQQRDLSDCRLVYLWAHDVYVKGGLESSKAALLVLIAFLRHRDTQIPPALDVHLILDNYATHKHATVRAWLARHPRYHVHYTPTYSSWLNQVEIWFGLITRQTIRRASFRNVRELIRRIRRIDRFVTQYNRTAQPFRWTATADSTLAKLTRLAKAISGTNTSADTAFAATVLRDTFARTYRRVHPRAVERLRQDWERMVGYHASPQEHWRHLRTTNVIESPFAAVRLHMSAAKRFKVVENATVLIWKTLLVVEQHFRKLYAPQPCTTVYDSAIYVDGIRVVTPPRALRTA